MSGGPSGGAGIPPVSPEEWQRLEPMIDLLLDADAEHRARLFVELADGDRDRQAELERLVAECEQAYPLLDRSAADHFAALLGEEMLSLPDVIAGRYQLLREAGHGGMAVVYVARDLKHARDVAVKVVRPGVAALLGRERFLREIEIAAQLRHPAIVPVYDSGEIPAPVPPDDRASVGSVLYYVMPYETGRSLRERLRRDGPLSIDDVLLILRDVCEALAHAHQHGVVHLDVKPDNVLLAGRHALVTDFGIARAVSEATSDAASEAPLAVSGVVLGTTAYMAPEQAANDPRVDGRADIYAVGVLAYELLEGSPPPARAAHRAPPPAMHRPDVPQELASLIAKCLMQRPADRWQSADELLEHLTQVALTAAAPAMTVARPRAHGRSVTRMATVLGLGVASLTALAIVVSRRRSDPLALQFGHARQLTSAPGLEVEPSLSPDGRDVAYAVGTSLRMRIAVLPTGGGKPARLTSDTTENQWLPRWSPDGTRILYLSSGGVFSAPAAGGRAREEVARRPGAIVTAAAWSPDAREIAYARGDSLLARNVHTGEARLITTGADLHSCAWSPNGAWLACVSGNSYYVTVGTMFGLGPMFGNLAPSRIVLVPAAGGVPVTVTDSGSLHQSPVWSHDGRTLYYVSDREGPRDVYALHVGSGIPTGAEPVRVTTGIGVQSIDLSSDGRRVVYAVYRTTANIWAMPIPRGHVASFASATPVTSTNQTIEGLRVSPDGRWLVYDSNLSGTSAVYRIPVNGGDAERLTHGLSDAFRGAISPDGKELVYHSFQTGSRNLFLAPLGGGPARQITRAPGESSMANWSPDGTALTYFDLNTQTVFVMRRDSRGRWGTPRVVAAHGLRPEWSPDGRTIAFVSPQDGRISAVPADSGARHDLYVPRAGDPLAELAIFAPSGRELYFKSHDARGHAAFWSIPITGGRPTLLVRLDDPAHASNRFEFASDGRRFYFTIDDRQSDLWVADVRMH